MVMTPASAPPPLYVDNSLLKAVQCSTQVALRNIYGYTSREEKEDLKCGSAAHKALAVWFTTKDKDKAIAEFAKDYQAWAVENVDDPDDARSWDNASLIMYDWFGSKGVELIKDVEVIPGFVEVGFAYPLAEGNEFIFCGRFDMLVRWRGQVYVWENKTTGNINYTKKLLRSGSQLPGYLWGARKFTEKYAAFKEVKISGIIINLIHFRKVPASGRRCSVHGVKYSECGLMHLGHQFLGPYGFAPEMVVEWEKTALNLARRYREILTAYPSLKSLPLLRTQGKFFGTCPSCTFDDFCIAGKPMDMIDNMLQWEPWSPFDEVIQESQNLYLSEQLAHKKVMHKTEPGVYYVDPDRDPPPQQQQQIKGGKKGGKSNTKSSSANSSKNEASA